MSDIVASLKIYHEEFVLRIQIYVHISFYIPALNGPLEKVCDNDIWIKNICTVAMF